MPSTPITPILDTGLFLAPPMSEQVPAASSTQHQCCVGSSCRLKCSCSLTCRLQLEVQAAACQAECGHASISSVHSALVGMQAAHFTAGPLLHGTGRVNEPKYFLSLAMQANEAF